MRKKLLAAAIVMVAGGPAAAQTSPYAGEASQASRTIAALSDQEVADLLDGAGMGFARAAELNGIPGPRHALELADSLVLDGAQRVLIEDVFAGMQTAARRLGTEIVELERELDAIFQAGEAQPDVVEQRTVELGRLYGRLRAVHLRAHLETAAILTPVQITRYAELRGYATGAPDAHAGSPADSTHH